MAIRLARESDADFVLEHLQGVPNAPRLDRDQIINLASRYLVAVDTVTRIAVALAPDPNRASVIWPNDFSADQANNTNPLGIVDIPWMLPRAKWNVDNINQFPPVLKFALDTLVKRFPATNNWPCGGEFEGDQVADTVGRLNKSREIGQFWKARFFPDIRVRDVPYAKGLARAEAATVGYLRTRLGELGF